jgi:enoyl-CoA hydratase/carnithine racemase
MALLPAGSLRAVARHRARMAFSTTALPTFETLTACWAANAIQTRRRAVARRRARMAFSTTSVPALPTFETLTACWAADAVVDLRLNRPDRANAMNRRMWAELVDAFRAFGDPALDVRAVVLSGAGRSFTTGLDLGDHAALLAPPPPPADGRAVDPARRAWALQRLVRSYQDAANALADFHAPVIAAVHGACIGGGVDLICAADIRVASADASFAVREVALGLAADVGTLQRLPGLVGNDSLVRQLAFTGEPLPAEDAARLGLLR